MSVSVDISNIEARTTSKNYSENNLPGQDFTAPQREGCSWGWSGRNTIRVAYWSREMTKMIKKNDSLCHEETQEKHAFVNFIQYSFINWAWAWAFEREYGRQVRK